MCPRSTLNLSSTVVNLIKTSLLTTFSKDPKKCENFRLDCSGTHRRNFTKCAQVIVFVRFTKFSLLVLSTSRYYRSFTVYFAILFSVRLIRNILHEYTV